MKNSLLFSAAIACAFAANAEVYNYGFGYTDNTAMPFITEIGTESSVFYYPGNYDLVDKYGKAMPNTLDIQVLNTPDGADRGVLDLGVGISMLDGNIYTVSDDPVICEENEFEPMPEENWKYPFLSWGEKGVTRTIIMPGWGSEEAWVGGEKNYNAATEADWIATKNGVQFTRLGTQNIVSRGDTYFQYPAVSGNVTVTVWAGTNLGGTANPDKTLEVAITPVIDGEVGETTIVSKENPADKVYYKLDPVTFDATGKNVAIRVGANNSLLNLMYVRIEGDPALAVNGIAADAADAAAYNLMGVKVNDSYKGLVIKNGKKYIQK